MSLLTSSEFKTAWTTELSQEFIDAAAQGGGDMVYIFNKFGATEEGVQLFSQVVTDQEIDLEELVTDFDEETGIFSLDYEVIDFEVIG